MKYIAYLWLIVLFLFFIWDSKNADKIQQAYISELEERCNVLHFQLNNTVSDLEKLERIVATDLIIMSEGWD